MAAPNLTKYRERDPNGHITITSTSASFSGLTRNESIGVYDSERYGDMIIDFTFSITSADVNSIVAFLNFGESSEGLEDQTDRFLVQFSKSGGNNNVFLNADGDVTADLEIYSDSGRTILLTTLSMVNGVQSSSYIFTSSTPYYCRLLRSDFASTGKTFSHFFVAQSFNTATTEAVTGSVSDIDITLDYPLEILSLPHKFDGSAFTVEGYGPSNTQINWINNTNAASGNVTSDDYGRWEISGSADVGANSLTVSASGETDQNLTVTRDDTTSFTTETVVVDTNPTQDFAGPFHSANYFDGLYEITTYQYEYGGALRYRLGKDIGTGLAFKDGDVAPLSTGTITAIEAGNYSIQDTFYAAWHNGRWVANNKVYSQVILDDDTVYDITARTAGVYEINLPIGAYSSISQYYVVNGHTYIAKFIDDDSGISYIRTYKSDNTTTGGTVTLSDEINLGATGTTVSKVELFGFSNSDVALIWTDENAGTLNYKYYTDSTDTWGSIQQVSAQITDISAFRAVGCDNDQLFFFYTVVDDLKLRIRSGGTGGTLAAEIDLVDNIDTFSATTDNGKDNAIQCHIRKGHSLYTLQILNNTPATLPVQITTGLATRNISAPYTEAFQTGILYQTIDNELKVSTVNIPRVRRSPDTTIFVGFSRPDYTALDILATTSGAFEHTAILSADVDGIPVFSDYNHVSESFESSLVPLYIPIWDYHNVPKLTLQNNLSIWFASGGREDITVGTNLPIDLFQSNLPWNNASFDPTNFTSLPSFLISGGRGYKDILVDSSANAYIIYMIGFEGYIRRYNGVSWGSGVSIYQNGVSRLYWNGSEILDDDTIQIAWTDGEDNYLPATSQGAVLSANTSHMSLSYSAGFICTNILGNTITLPAQKTDQINVSLSTDAVDQYNLPDTGKWVSVPDRIINTAYIVGDQVTFANHWWECTIGGTSSSDPSPTPTIPQGGLFVDNTVTWRKDGYNNDGLQFIGTRSRQNKAHTSTGAPVYARSVSDLTDYEITNKIIVQLYTTDQGWIEVEVANNSVDTLGPAPVMTDDGNGVLYVFYLKLTSGVFQFYFKKSADDGITWTDETQLRTSTYAQRELVVVSRGNANNDISAAYVEDVSPMYGEVVLIESILAPSVRATSIVDQFGNPVVGASYQIDSDAGAYVLDEVVETTPGLRTITANEVSGYTAQDPFTVNVPDSGILDFTITYNLDAPAINEGDTIDNQFTLLRDAGYTGAFEDMLLQYYNDLNSASDTCLIDAQYKYLKSQGYGGSLPDMIYIRSLE